MLTFSRLENMVGGHRVAFKILSHIYQAQILANSNVLGYSIVKSWTHETLAIANLREAILSPRQNLVKITAEIL